FEDLKKGAAKKAARAKTTTHRVAQKPAGTRHSNRRDTSRRARAIAIELNIHRFATCCQASPFEFATCCIRFDRFADCPVQSATHATFLLAAVTAQEAIGPCLPR